MNWSRFFCVLVVPAIAVPVLMHFIFPRELFPGLRVEHYGVQATRTWIMLNIAMVLVVAIVIARAEEREGDWYYIIRSTPDRPRARTDRGRLPPPVIRDPRRSATTTKPTAPPAAEQATPDSATEWPPRKQPPSTQGEFR